MFWYVKLWGRVVGTVVAVDEPQALAFAYAKFGGWEFARYEVVARSR